MRLPAPLLAALGVLASACGTSNTGGADAAVAFDGAALGKCASDDTMLIPAADCPATGCIGSEAFAFCVGTSYASCACDPPSGDVTFVDASPALEPDAATEGLDGQVDADRPGS
jgi:hypothetical protein